MKSQNIIFICNIVVTVIGFFSSLEMTSAKISLEQRIEQQLNKEQLLHASGQNAYQSIKRKRRYLEFPEGSSFQLVYDLIVGVVDYTNYLILGVTVALAWELPSKPPSEILDDLTERLKDGTLGTSRNDTIEKIKYIDMTNITKIPANIYQYNLQPMFRPPMHYQYYTPRTPESFYKYPNDKHAQGLQFHTPNKYNTWSIGRNKFYTSKQTHPFAKWTENKKVPKFSAKGIKYPWWHLPERLKNSFTTRPSIRRLDKNIVYGRARSTNKRPTGTYSTFRGTERSEHRIYPVFGKRSISDEEIQNKNFKSSHLRYRRRGIITEHLSKLDRIHLQHHRKTRHDLYERIETYLNGRGSHGHHCVLRALCETGQKTNEHTPGSFVGELMRAVFTMPEPLDATVAEGRQQIGYKALRYDAANALKEDCAIRYNHCKDSLWSSHFVI